MKAAALFAVTLCAAAYAAPKVVDRVAALVNDDMVLLSDVEERAAAELARAGRILADVKGREREKLLCRVLDDLVAEKLLESEMRALNIDVTDAEVDYAIDDVKKQNKMDAETFDKALAKEGYAAAGYREFMRKQLARMKLLQLKVRSKVRVSDEDVKAEYARRAKQDEQDEEVHARHVLFRIPKDADEKKEAEVRARAAEVARRARSGEDFVQLAKTYSEGPSRDEGGDLGFFRRGVMVAEFERTAFGLKAGEVSDPVKTSFGYHVLKVEQRRKLAPKPFEDLRDELRERLLRDRSNQYTSDYVDELRRAAIVDVKVPELREGACRKPGQP